MLQQMLREARLYFQGVRVDNIDSQQALMVVSGFLHDRDSRYPRRVFFTNVHSIHLARNDKELQACVNEADLVLPDGSGLKIAGKILRHPIVENLNGTDFIPKVLERAAEMQWSVYLFGGRPHVTAHCCHRLQTVYPTLNIVGQQHGYVYEKEEQMMIADINAKSPDILLVGLGSPLQEKWIARNAPNLHAGVCFAVGGLFDFLAGEYHRAPSWTRRIGAEFVYRLAQSPSSKWQRTFVEAPLFLLGVFATLVTPGRTGALMTQPEKDNEHGND
jgi:N-acetylglucosaminyldiphosphoundecaprenol N-acetyl-beta-D-mannosaminyltransferase